MRRTGPARRRLASALLAGVIALSGYADGGADVGQVRIAGSGWIVDAPTKVAERLGLFRVGAARVRASGIRVEYARSGQHALQSLLAGDAEFALVAPAPVAAALLAREPGPSDPVVLASVGLSNQSHYLVAPPGSGIATPGDLGGRRVGVQLGTSAHYVWTHFARQHGLDDAGVELVDVAVTDHGRALEEGSVDAVLGWDPGAAELIERLGSGATRMALNVPHAVDWLLVTTRAQLDRDPAAAVAVLRGYREAIELIARDPERARALHAEVGGVPAGVLRSLEAGVIWDLALGWRVLVGLESQFDWLAGEGGARPLPSRYLAAAPLLAVAPEAVTIPPYLHDGTANANR